MQFDYHNKEATYYSGARTDLLPHIPRSNIKTWLDVGCSGGQFGVDVKGLLNCKVWGIEPHAQAASIASLKLDRVIVGTLEVAQPQLDGHTFDCISFNDVLEHMVDPWSVLTNVKKYLSRDGIIFSSIPNVLHTSVLKKLLFEQDWAYQSDGVLDQTHLRFFTRKSIYRLFEKCGYRVSYIEGINPEISKNRVYYFNKYFFANKLKDSKYLQYVVHAIRD